MLAHCLLVSDPGCLPPTEVQKCEKTTNKGSSNLDASRLFDFVVLDEATCSMDNTSEIEMFKQCQLLNITCITVSHQSLDRFHQQKITISGLGTWSWSEIDPDEVDDDDEEDTLGRGDSMSAPAPGVGLRTRLPGDGSV